MLQIESLHVSIQSVEALRGLSLTVPGGQALQAGRIGALLHHVAALILDAEQAGIAGHLRPIGYRQAKFGLMIFPFRRALHFPVHSTPHFIAALISVSAICASRKAATP